MQYSADRSHAAPPKRERRFRASQKYFNDRKLYTVSVDENAGGPDPARLVREKGWHDAQVTETSVVAPYNSGLEACVQSLLGRLANVSPWKSYNYSKKNAL